MGADREYLAARYVRYVPDRPRDARRQMNFRPCEKAAAARRRRGYRWPANARIVSMNIVHSSAVPTVTRRHCGKP